LEEQNYLSKENNIAQYADKIEYLNEQIKTKSDHVKKLTGFHFAKLVSLAKHFPAIAGGIIYYKDNLYSVSVGYRSVDSLKEKIKTCLSYDEYCAEWIHNTSMQIELTLNNQNNNEILNPNPY